MSDFLRFALQHGRVGREEQCRLVNELAAKGSINIPLLVSALNQNDSIIKDYAARALGRIGIANPKIVSALGAALDHPQVQVKQAAVVALCSISPPPLSAKDMLIKVLTDADEEVRYYANEALRRINKYESSVHLNKTHAQVG